MALACRPPERKCFLAFQNWIAYPVFDETAPPRRAHQLPLLRILGARAWCREPEDLDLKVITRHF